ncbi:MAG TPA: saccharopine dehydrogenase C-terminal domain-containing protein [bacterium]|nr:saccharopine dehydrogenase C-terminal domain-containing protein [bacterium]HQG45692.1 saccharopine dehydrogenase C-terminal domain-containing protein [bacterium]HQI48620.1 saccharopine dehydrogenase C-terminal domain-containing protein [bacterium]HQJ63970.1 saccharopine dehydrogenase C-terminal domain-containing protein [bacterium]
MKKIMLLGAGMVGKAMAIDLCRDFEVTAVDMEPAALQPLQDGYPIRTLTADLSQPQTVTGLAAGQDLILGAVPGFMGYRTLEAVLTAGVNCVDISFFPEDPFGLDALAQARGVTAVVDCGVAPGMSNLILGYHQRAMSIDRFECLVGGLPLKRDWPFEYKAPFSPLDVIEEYLRPARLIENGRIVTRPALSEPELVNLAPVGTLEAFNTDGLRTLLNMTGIPDMKEKTLRYPGHCQLMKILRDTGFLSDEPISCNGARISPRELTSSILLPQWKLGEAEKEFTIMRIILEGRAADGPRKHLYHLYDVYDEETRTSSMARTTGYTATAAARLVLAGRFARKGICPPEYLGAEAGCFEAIMADLAARRVIYTHEER